jgi:hypothetical protein
MTHPNNPTTVSIEAAAHRRISFPHFSKELTVSRFVELQALVAAGGDWDACVAHAEASGYDIRQLEDSLTWWDNR